jgi:hypothetical protein
MTAFFQALTQDALDNYQEGKRPSAIAWLASSFHKLTNNQ